MAPRKGKQTEQAASSPTKGKEPASTSQNGPGTYTDKARALLKLINRGDFESSPGLAQQLAEREADAVDLSAALDGLKKEDPAAEDYIQALAAIEKGGSPAASIMYSQRQSSRQAVGS